MKEALNYLRYILPVAIVVWGIASNRPDVEVESDELEEPKATQEKVVSTKVLPQASKTPDALKPASPLLSPSSSQEGSNPQWDYQQDAPGSLVESQTFLSQEKFYKKEFERQYLEESLTPTPVPSSISNEKNPTYTIANSYQADAPKITPTPTPTQTPSHSGSGQMVLSVVSDAISGTYGLPLDVSLSLKLNGANYSDGHIYYCEGTTAPCCDVLASSSTYTTSIDLGDEGDGDYCLSFYGKTNSGISTNPTELYVHIDSTHPSAPLPANTHFQMQSTERYVFAVPALSYIGSPSGLALSFYHTRSSSYTTGDCQEVSEETTGLDFNQNGTTDEFDFVQYLLYPFDLFFFRTFAPLEFEENYYFALLSKKLLDVTRMNCSKITIDVEDFPAFSSLPLSHGTSGSSEFYGTFTNVGYFQEAPTATSGSARKDELHSDFLNTIF